MAGGLFRIAALSELLLTGDDPAEVEWVREAVHRATGHADVLALCGNLTSRGLPQELRPLVSCLAETDLPVVAVLGQRDYDADREDELHDVLEDSGVRVLDGSAVQIGTVGFAGVKGMGGGFGPLSIDPVGEPALKAYIREAQREVDKLEVALAALPAAPRIVLMHYAPVDATLGTEPQARWPWLGSSRFWKPIRAAGVSAVFHGQASRGSALAIRNDIPVFNVSRPILAAEGTPVRIWSSRFPAAIAGLEEAG